MKYPEIQYFIVSYDRIITARSKEDALEILKDIYDSTCGPAWVFEKRQNIYNSKTGEVYILTDEEFEKQVEEWEKENPDEMVSKGY